MLEKMAATIEIAAAATTNPADRDMIFRKIVEDFPGGLTTRCSPSYTTVAGRFLYLKRPGKEI